MDLYLVPAGGQEGMDLGGEVLGGRRVELDLVFDYSATVVQ